ncbi:MAG: CapA family protein [Chloroflexi bacterium]|nr:CapA family protein [Chloroflexota bacterium]
MISQTGQQDNVVILLGGDVSPRRVEFGEPPESLFALAHDKMQEADIRFCHVPHALSTRGCLQYRTHITYYERQSPENIRSLTYAGFNVVCHASNNCFDYGPEAMADTLDLLRRNNIKVVGAGKNIAEARTPAIFETNGVKVGFLSYCCVVMVEYEAREDKPGVCPIRVATYFEIVDVNPGAPPKIITIPREDDVRAMEEDVRKLRSQVDVVVVSMHWGTHEPGTLAMYQPVVGHRAIDAGADLVVGHHGALLKGIEMYKGKAIFYSLAHLAVEKPANLKPPPGVHSKGPASLYMKTKSSEPGWERYPGAKERRYSMLVKCVAGKNGVRKISFLPVYINRLAEPEFVSQGDPRFSEVVGYAERWCKELSANLTAEGDEIVVSERR